MTGLYDHLSHPFFLYYSESIKVATQNMGCVQWIEKRVFGDLTVIFSATPLQAAKPPCHQTKKCNNSKV